MAEADRDRRKLVFDGAAEAYDRSRPGYPSELFADLFTLAEVAADSDVLEVGCGTGQASLPLARAGCRLTCLDIGPNLARIAAKNLAAFPNVTVLIGAFESFPATEHFDLILSATSWHWLDPAKRCARAAELLSPNGFLAIVTTQQDYPEGFDRYFLEVQQLYEEIGWKMEAYPPTEKPAVEAAELEECGRFEEPVVHSYRWSREYGADEYVELLNTYSDHRLLGSVVRRGFLDKAKALIESRPGGKIRKHYLNRLVLAKRAT